MKQAKRSFATARLIGKFLRHELSSEESESLRRWKEESEENRLLWERVTNPVYLEEHLQYWEDKEDKSYHWEQLTEKIAEKQALKVNFRRKALRYAAILVPVIFICGAGAYFFRHTKKFKKADGQGTLAGVHIMPKGKVARLVMADGKTISLNGNLRETFTESDGTALRNQDNTLKYFPAPGNTYNEILYNTLETPRGGEYEVKLSDGTKVWLNAASSLRYPARFIGKERRVYLSGEAYFEVTPDARHPFMVNAGKAVITVLGTRFNVSAYPGNPRLKTTLAEGLIKISDVNENPVGGSGIVINPGYEAIVKENEDNIRINKANVEAELGWKNGMFIFDQETLGSLMRKLSRWYDVDIKYHAGVDTLAHFTGRIQRYENITGILHLMELTGKVQFGVKGKEVEIMPK